MKKRSKSARLLLAMLLVSGALLLPACAKSPPDYFAYTQRAASAEISGTLMGNEFCAKIVLSPSGAGRRAEIEYVRHPALQGISLTAYFDAGGRLAQSVTVSGKGMTREQSAASLSGLLAPLCALLESREPCAVSFDGKAYTLSLANGALTVDREGIPCKWRSEALDFWIVWWENGE